MCLRERNPMLVDIVNIDLLTMLLAYDKMPNEKLLIAAERLAVMILNDDSFPELSYESRFVNLLQIYKRRRDFTDQEKEQIYDIYETSNMYDIKTATALLLDNSISAKYNFSRMSENEQEFFKTLPIYRFWIE